MKFYKTDVELEKKTLNYTYYRNYLFPRPNPCKIDHAFHRQSSLPFIADN